ncbi:MAG: pyruvate formate-lyase [Ruminococcaceae bacterium]|nr:pyruvate formate-lyase [Oscillospiraceae bacterium]
MKERIQRQLDMIKSREHRKLRRDLTEAERAEVLSKINDRSLSYMERATVRLEMFLDMEKPVLLEDTRIQGMRTIIDFPDIYAEGEMEEIKKTHWVHERGKVTNLAWDYYTVLKEGLEGRRARLENGKKADPEYVAMTNRTIDAVEKFADKYADEMDRQGKSDDAATLRRIIRHGADTLEEAFQLFRIVHFAHWASWCYHNTVGRFDQWAYPFYKNDIERGILTEETALDLIEDFFLSFNRDSDLYWSLAWGDNGQSMMLGGVKRDGSSAVNELTYMSMEASRELRMIDPKINLRVDKNTPLDLYEKGTELTKIGVGFPQYANDDIVIPGLVKVGYDIEDAREYSVAACWEFIVPNIAMDIPNIGAMPLADIANNIIRTQLNDINSTEEFMEIYAKAVREKALEITASHKNLFIEPSPMQSLLQVGALEAGRDFSEGSKYNNYGLHGTGYSCAVDQIAAIDSLIFKQGKITKERLLEGLKDDFETDKELRYILRNEADKVGRDDSANEIGNQVLDIFAKSLEGIKNERGGIYRAGTGSAMYYVWHGETLSATADGRDKGASLPANFSPSLFITNAGPFSALKGFAPASLVNAVNGGPMTFELHESVFNSDDSIEKVATLVRSYIQEGGHQLQINSVNNEKMRKAQENPEEYKDLIVRVWGWSGHFVEMDKCYQDQIIQRHEFGV